LLCKRLHALPKIVAGPSEIAAFAVDYNWIQAMRTLQETLFLNRLVSNSSFRFFSFLIGRASFEDNVTRAHGDIAAVASR